MTLAELFSLEEQIKLEILDRQKPIERNTASNTASRFVVSEKTTARGTFRLEYVKCGHCERCNVAPAHGPYWYRYFRAGGKTRSEYIGKTLARNRRK